MTYELDFIGDEVVVVESLGLAKCMMFIFQVAVIARMRLLDCERSTIFTEVPAKLTLL